MPKRTRIYTIYTADEKVLMHHLLKQLKSAEVDQTAEIWYDDSIKSGQLWKPSDKARLYDADIFLLLISNAFMYSEFIKQLEFKIIIDRYKAGTTKVIPLILENCPWNIDFESEDYTFNFNELQVLPEVGKPLKTWNSFDQALSKSAAYIKKLIATNAKNQVHEQSNIGEEEIGENEKTEDQLALSFSQEAEAEKRVEEENWFRERMDTKPEAIRVAQTEFFEDEPIVREDENVNSRKKMLLTASLLTFALIAIVLFFRNMRDSSPEANKDSIVIQDTNVEDKSKTTNVGAGASLAKLSTGDSYKNGIIFKIDGNGESGIIAHLEDVGPMTWNDAMKIHEKLGEGWRLPTLVELKRMHSTIGQGASNKGKFADKLYWSATPYDSNQARLVRFEDGNTSFHYNSIGDFRKFLVRAVKDFD